jgi:hypothetical protein
MAEAMEKATDAGNKGNLEPGRKLLLDQFDPRISIC